MKVLLLMPILHDGAASALLLWRVWVVALVDLVRVQHTSSVDRPARIHTVPQRLGTMKSLGSLSVKAMRLANS